MLSCFHRFTYHTHIPVDCSYPFVRVLLEQFAGDELLEGEHNAILTPYTNCRATILYRLHCIFDLEVAAVGREDGVGEIVARTYRGLP